MFNAKLILCWSTFSVYYTTQSFRIRVYQRGLILTRQYFYKNIPEPSSCEGAISHFRSSFRFRSGLWLGHAKTLTFFWLSHSLANLDVCFGSLACWKAINVFLHDQICGWRTAALKHYAATTMLHSRYGVPLVMFLCQKKLLDFIF